MLDYIFYIFSTYSGLIIMFMPFILLVIYILRWTGVIKINITKYLGVFILAMGLLLMMQIRERESKKKSYILSDFEKSNIENVAKQSDTSTIKSNPGDKPE